MTDILLEGLSFPESPVWSKKDGCLYFTEWKGNRLSAWRDGHYEVVFELEEDSGPSAVEQDSEGNFWLCLYDACVLAKFNSHGHKQAWIDNHEGWKFRGVCDLALDKRGGIYFSDSGDFEEDWITGRPVGAIYYLKPDGELIQVDAGICFPNGMALSPHGNSLYVNEHRANRVLLYTIGGGGELSNRRVFYELDDNCLLAAERSFELGPDGCCVDDLGNFYVAHYGGGKLVKIRPDGIKIGDISLPHGRMPTNLCCHAEQEVLYVTEAEYGLLYRVEISQ